MGDNIFNYCDKNIKIYVKGKKEKPESWDKNWNSLTSHNEEYATVYWDK